MITPRLHADPNNHKHTDRHAHTQPPMGAAEPSSISSNNKHISWPNDVIAALASTRYLRVLGA